MTRLADLIGELRGRAARLNLRTDLHAAAADLACHKLSGGLPVLADERAVAMFSSLLHTAALALAGATRPVLYQVRPAAALLVHETDLHSLPDAAPGLLCWPWLVEVPKPENGEALWGNTVALGGYELHGCVHLVGAQYPDGIIVAQWWPVWSGDDIETGVQYQSSGIGDVDGYREWALDAARFAVLFGLMLEAEGVPFRVDVERPRSGYRKSSRWPTDPREWTVRHVSLDEYAMGRSRAAELGELAAGGHLKRQRFGAGSEQVRWIYVGGYEARRWNARTAAIQVAVSKGRDEK